MDVTTSIPNAAPPTFSYFCIYNPSFGPTEETQEEQLLYYVANKKIVPMDVKMRQIGLAQGLTNFTKVFSPTKPCENVHTQKNRLAFYKPESDYWMLISIELGYVKKIIKDKDGKPKTVIEFQDANLHDSSVRRMLEMGYEMYRIFNGPFDLTVRTSGVETLKNKLEEFFADWVFEWDFEKTELTKTIDGILYLPLSAKAHSEVTSFVENTEENLQIISNTFVLWKSDLIYGGDGNVADIDIREIWRHLVKLSEKKDKEMLEILEKQKKNKESEKYLLSTFNTFKGFPNLLSYLTTPKASPSVSPQIPPERSDSPSPPPSVLPPVVSIPSNFLTEPTQNLDGADNLRPITIFIKKQRLKSSKGSTKIQQENINVKNEMGEEGIDKYYFVVYKQSSLTLGFIIPTNSDEATTNVTNIGFYRSLQDYLSPRIEPVIKVLEEDYEQSQKIVKPDADKEYRYLFHNKLTLAVKCSINAPNNSPSSPKNLMITNDMANALCDMYEDFERYPNLTEIITKSATNFWIVGKRSEGRYLYVVVPKKDALLQVEEDVKRLASLHFSGVFLD